MRRYISIIASLAILATTAAFGRDRAAASTRVGQAAAYVSSAENGGQAAWAAQHRIDKMMLDPMQASGGVPVVLTGGRGGGGMHGGGGSFHGDFHSRSFGGHGFHRDFDSGRTFHHMDYDRDRFIHHSNFYIDDFYLRGYYPYRGYYYYPHRYSPYSYYYPYGYSYPYSYFSFSW
jgi:hypothetical protein